MSGFDYDKIKDMEYDPSRGRYVGEDGREFKSTPYSNGTGYKYDYYESSTYGNAPHNSTHVKSDLNENWDRTDNNRDTGEQSSSSGSGCYLTTACMENMLEKFDDDCEELTLLRWFRDNYVSKEDISHYYKVAPTIVSKINAKTNKSAIYHDIYTTVIIPCVEAIKIKNYDFVYKTYKNNVLELESVYC